VRRTNPFGPPTSAVECCPDAEAVPPLDQDRGPRESRRGRPGCADLLPQHLEHLARRSGGQGKKQDRVIGFFWECFRRSFISQNPALSLSKIRPKHVPTDYYPRHEFDKIIDTTYIYGDPRGGYISIDGTRTRLRTLTLLMRWSGLRIRDAVKGTAIFKTVPSLKELPSSPPFLSLDMDGCSLPSDWSSGLAEAGAATLHGDIPKSSIFPLRLSKE
jgi:hypothetical protein